MAQYTRIEVANVMKENGMVPLFYHPDVELGKKVLKAVYDGGARLMEFTARGDFAFEVFSELNKYAIKELPGMILGVGSITDAAAASMFMQMGANFIVTPSLRVDIAKVCNRRKVLWSPGCGSLTEINAAEELGCEVVKLFPGDLYGPGFVKGIKGPQPWTSIMPTGGVSTDEANLKGWFDAGVTCVGMGSKLISKEVLANKDYAGLEKTVRETLALIKRLRA
ncbi:MULTISPECIES: bifunctional 4-hydroxy-2-oxoglutarate aldolase/2-dehydro-3-deoxy-phosphogluconate aldolase [Cellulophaga]|jgi:2-dehydro-3-deoxyphosphogluconate aldolase/(4S)-4-hydroxy-2-oxoglutarate aldolase|uniref:2-dehydro-3-deoxyphosphogluconate aldolase / (4S)-4-hydroxy-2-oxoglutarate aldolase n=2 Tax=Cellulophaga baltica TaxID=76594 RepID=A0A1G7K4S5_9FLAO|nr:MULTISPECIES: bifunctional 4-hydroxy-2-oxoglutarate aldolase/2-dehydro-3-deoxy-phosphogluconate aldolase [Cellulophaga]WFO17341.1 bifunctional 4-hydroxy-2-oxoglutarate aldolase/2-dehydro-3-deoxy-phosphogluconate aldolase [Cellulophaga baltica 4]AIZ42257.1 keto-deoxy-phosphogluconate aldolase [Cellulophaga baltica 18]KGK29098.1 keto-deoxy-phosphogluconate aldolase [Cellulophaga sp. E6(2014)]MBA6314754.1 bifunctional 4-hydroxy-2-oxoglutarate aldolase/2-dehydro-3-deoxy-phosphogluconate aldolase